MHFSQSFNNNNNISKNLNLHNQNLSQNNLSFNFINHKNINSNNNNSNNINNNNLTNSYSNSSCKNSKIKLNCQNCCGAATPNTNYNIVNNSNKINFSCNTTNVNIVNSNTNTNNSLPNNTNISVPNTNNVKNDKFTDIDALVAYINTNSKIKKIKRKVQRKKFNSKKCLKLLIIMEYMMSWLLKISRKIFIKIVALLRILGK